MSFGKKTRESVYAKYDGHCAYCGRSIDIRDMQVDHFLPLRAWGIEEAGTDDISNLMPACRMCNHGEFGAEMKFDSDREIPREELERSIDKNVLLKMMCLDQLGYTGKDVTFISPEEYDKQYGDDDNG